MAKNPQELLKTFRSVWPPLVDREIEPRYKTLIMDIEGEEFELALLEGVAPNICREFLKILPLKGHLIHAAWSGEVIRQLESFELPVTKPENATYYCAPGDVCYTLGHKEFTIMYGDNNCRMPYGNVQENVFAVIKNKMRKFQEVCQLIRLTGAKDYEIRLK